MQNISDLSLEDIKNESDVEQKLIYSILTSERPIGLGFPGANIKTKPSIKPLEIGKRKKKRVYFPDYIIVVSGLPLIIVEAKPPSDDVVEGYREARLYACELNSKFSHSVNPLTKIICSNGKKLIAGFSDTDLPKYDISFEEITTATKKYFDFSNEFCLKELQDIANEINKKLKAKKYFNPVRLLGGKSVRNEEVGTNSFGNMLALEYQHVFNPTTPKEREYIVKNAYIKSESRKRYVQPIDKIVRAAIPPSESDSKRAGTGKPIVKKLKELDKSNLEHKILLLIGGVGTGKSTFVDYLRYQALPKDLTKSTTWIHVDMNDAPLDGDMIYAWICSQIISNFKAIYSDIDTEDLDVLLKIYSTDINKFNKVAQKLFKVGSEKYNSELFDKLKELQNDKIKTVKSYIRYFCAERNKLAILVLDNCDKRVRDEQLLMFQAAQWIQHEFRCLIFLPIRDITYDNHRHEPPLDTALKDLVFRIEAPGFHEVLVARIKLALKEMSKKSSAKTLEYSLPNKMRVTFPSEKLAYFLTSILRALFENNNYLRWMLVGLAGRNLRKAMEIFLEFCKSNHISEDEILKICQSEGKYSIPFHIIFRVMMRMNRRFYSSDQSYIKNLFHYDRDDIYPFYFVRLAILRWLHINHKTLGPINQPGYHKVSALKADLFLLGLSNEVVSKELVYLLRARCIEAEHLRLNSLEDEDLISLAPAGFVHLELMGKTDYLASVSEDIFFDQEDLARQIKRNISDKSFQYTREASLQNSRYLVSYLNLKLKDITVSPDSFIEGFNINELLSLGSAVENLKSNDPWFNIADQIREGDILEGTVVGVVDFGVFVQIRENVDGLMHVSNLTSRTLNEFKKGEEIQVCIVSIDEIARRISLSFYASASKNIGGSSGHTNKTEDRTISHNKSESGLNQKDSVVNIQNNNNKNAVDRISDIPIPNEIIEIKIKGSRYGALIFWALLALRISGKDLSSGSEITNIINEYLLLDGKKVFPNNISRALRSSTLISEEWLVIDTDSHPKYKRFGIIENWQTYWEEIFGDSAPDVEY